MEELRPLILELRRVRDDDEKYSDNRIWNQILAIFQLICCIVFVMMIPSFAATYMVQQNCMKNKYRLQVPGDTSCTMEKWWTTSEITQNVPMNYEDFNTHIEQTIDAYFQKLTNWLILKTFAALLHIISSLLLLFATLQKISRFHRILFCGSAKYINMTYLAYEYINLITFGVPAKNDQFNCIICLVYRILFHSKVDELLDTLVNTSAPPPGHK